MPERARIETVPALLCTAAMVTGTLPLVWTEATLLTALWAFATIAVVPALIPQPIPTRGARLLAAPPERSVKAVRVVAGVLAIGLVGAGIYFVVTSDGMLVLFGLLLGLLCFGGAFAVLGATALFEWSMKPARPLAPAPEPPPFADGDDRAAAEAPRTDRGRIAIVIASVWIAASIVVALASKA